MSFAFPSLALQPDLNVRVFPAGSIASLRAAARWAELPRAEETGARNVLLEAPGPALAAALTDAVQRSEVDAWRHEARFWLSGSRAHLFDLAGMLLGGDAARVGAELRAALSAHEAARRPAEAALVMGILNVTPDSFSDGGRWLDPAAAVDRALEMVGQGAGVIDVGGESTRPGAREIPVEEELRRVLPVVEALREVTNALISIDTRKAGVAQACLDAGADWVNDVSGLRHDPGLAGVVAARPGTRLVLMHSLRPPGEDRYSTEYDPEGRPAYEDVVSDTLRWLRRQALIAAEAGVPPDALWIDPGFGFGKTYEQNLDLLRRVGEYTSAGLPVLVGTSRKSSVGKMVGDLPPEERLEGTAATVAWAVAAGAAAVRVHDVREIARVVRAIDTLRRDG